ncbi:MAG: hypothetical protein HY815_04115 [Candidatus Riflebacteria bacterium]|nr:hypothetical protein [Candidatus Riflebacteria bacterium]
MGTMLAIYIATLLFGGFFVGMSVLSGMEGGHGGHDALGGAHDAHDGIGGLHLEMGHADAGNLAETLHLDMSADVPALPDGDITAEHVTDLVHAAHNVPTVADSSPRFVPFLSIRFWTFGACFFGMTGTILTLLKADPIVCVVLSALMGGGSGLTVTALINRLQRDQFSSHMTERDYPGLLGRVIVPIRTGQSGKIRCQARGQIIDLIAESDEKMPLEKEMQVLVIEYKDGVARVVHAGRLSALLTVAKDQDS